LLSTGTMTIGNIVTNNAVNADSVALASKGVLTMNSNITATGTTTGGLTTMVSTGANVVSRNISTGVTGTSGAVSGNIFQSAPFGSLSSILLDASAPTTAGSTSIPGSVYAVAGTGFTNTGGINVPSTVNAGNVNITTGSGNIQLSGEM